MIGGPFSLGGRIYCHPQLPGFVGNGGANTFAMSALNAGYCVRHQATDTRDYKSVWINWSSVATPGTVQLRVETIDTTTLKPTGTLYDANAVKSFTPSAGWQNVAFDVLPTTGRTVGNLYGVVLLTTVAGTTQTLRAGSTAANGAASQPTDYATGANANTRSNLSLNTNGLPSVTFVMEDDAEEFFGGIPFATHTTFGVYGTRAFASKLTLLNNVLVDGITCYLQVGTVANLTGDLRAYILDSTGSIVSGTDVTLTRKIFATDFSVRTLLFPFASQVTLAVGTYRVVLRNTDSASASGAAFNIASGDCRSSAVNTSGLILSTTTDITAGTPTWTDTAASQPVLGLSLSGIPAGSGGTGLQTKRSMNGGFGD